MKTKLLILFLFLTGCSDNNQIKELVSTSQQLSLSQSRNAFFEGILFYQCSLLTNGAITTDTLDAKWVELSHKYSNQWDLPK